MLSFECHIVRTRKDCPDGVCQGCKRKELEAELQSTVEDKRNRIRKSDGPLISEARDNFRHPGQAGKEHEDTFKPRSGFFSPSHKAGNVGEDLDEIYKPQVRSGSP